MRAELARLARELADALDGEANLEAIENQAVNLLIAIQDLVREAT